MKPKPLLERLHDEIARIAIQNGQSALPVQVTRETRTLLEEAAAEIEAAENIRKELAKGLGHLASVLTKPLKLASCPHGTPNFQACPSCVRQ